MKEFERSSLGNAAQQPIISMEESGTESRLRFQQPHELKRTNPIHQRVPFNGLLTNKLLAALPGPDFARLLPHMEAVSLAASQTIYGFGENVNFAYFPETAVITHLYVLEDGSTTAADVM